MKRFDSDCLPAGHILTGRDGKQGLRREVIALIRRVPRVAAVASVGPIAIKEGAFLNESDLHVDSAL